MISAMKKIHSNAAQLNEGAAVETELRHSAEPRLFLDESMAESHESDNHEANTETQPQTEQTVVMADNWKANEIEHLHVAKELSTFDEPQSTDPEIEEVTQFEAQSGKCARAAKL